MRSLFIHLRLHFQFLLAPIFLWGFLLAEGTLNGQFWLAFVALHIFLYGGTTAYNSFYDRDEGPVGGLENPPEVTPALLPFSLVWQAIGAVMAWFVNPMYFGLYVVIFAFVTAYSHPVPRLKGRPVGGLLTIALAQGLLCGLAGSAAADPTLASLSTLDWLGLVASTGVTTGFYPVTQIYQVQEDLARGDRTFAAHFGHVGTFRFALTSMSLAALGLAIVFAQLFPAWQTALLVIFVVGLLVMIGRWAAQYDPAQVLVNYRQVMRLYTVMTGGFGVFLALHLLGVL